jgi:hypothetical protein
LTKCQNEYGLWEVKSAQCISECTGYGQENYFPDMVNIFRDIFDKTFTLQLLEDEDINGVQLFKDEQEKLKRLNSKKLIERMTH